MEEKEVASITKANLLATEFDKSFLAIIPSFHPYAIAGEAAGKSSNVAFAAHRVFANHRNDAQDVIITIMDGKSQSARCGPNLQVQQFIIRHQVLS
jgi:hypothetical protein